MTQPRSSYSDLPLRRVLTGSSGWQHRWSPVPEPQPFPKGCPMTLCNTPLPDGSSCRGLLTRSKDGPWVELSVLQGTTIRGQQKASPHRVNGRGHGTEGVTSMQEQPTTATCKCGCGQPAAIARKTNRRDGVVKGQPLQYARGHLKGRPIPGAGPNPSGLCQCGCGQQTDLATYTDRRSGIGTGQHYCYIKGHSTRRDALERFWEKVDKEGPTPEHRPELGRCWMWTASRQRHQGSILPYGNFDGGRAHRFAYKALVGPVPVGMFVLHHCDNPPCVNPAHLFVGTQADNVRDMLDKGRGCYRIGEDNPRAKLSQADVIEIRRLLALRPKPPSKAALARQFSVSPSLIRAIAKGVVWSGVTEGLAS